MKEIQEVSRKEKSEKTKNAIYKSAEELFTKYGYSGTSVESIVKSADLSKGSFYVHFESKDALIANLVNDYVNKLDMDYKAYLESFSTNLSADVILMLLIKKIAEVMTDNIGYDKMKAVYRAQISKDINTNYVMGYNRQLYQMFEDIFEAGIRKNELKTNLSPAILAKHFIMAFRRITYEWCVRYPEFDFKAQSIQHFELMISGLKG